jgi:hypothetical protein
MTSDYMVLNVDASATELRPLSFWERVGVRGYGLSIGPNPSPGLLRMSNLLGSELINLSASTIRY